MDPAGLTCRVCGRTDGGKDPTCPLWRGIATHKILSAKPLRAIAMQLHVHHIKHMDIYLITCYVVARDLHTLLFHTLVITLVEKLERSTIDRPKS